MTLFKQKYRIESARLRGWDYSAAGYYFVTFCTHGRVPCLGEVTDGDVRLTRSGEIVAEEWLKTEAIRPNVRLDEWIVMPNHVHGIIVITHQIDDATTGTAQRGRPPVETGRRPVSTTTNIQPNSLGAIVGQIKSITTKRIRRSGNPDFRWQERFYDRIIRDQEALIKARAYIVGNPAKWADDWENAPGIYM